MEIRARGAMDPGCCGGKGAMVVEKGGRMGGGRERWRRREERGERERERKGEEHAKEFTRKTFPHSH